MLILLLITSHAFAADLELPAFLSEPYRTAFAIAETRLSLTTHTTKDGVEHYLYSSTDNGLFLSIDYITGDSPKQKAVMSNIVRYLAQEIDTNSGAFIKLAEHEIYANVHNSGTKRHVFVYALPSGVQVWTFSGLHVENMDVSAKFDLLLNLSNRQRYLDADTQGNVSMGTWGAKIHNYARMLLKEGKKKEALTVLTKIVATSPYNFRAHLDIVLNSPDVKIAENSARVILRNAEDPELIAEAMKYLGVRPVSNESLAVLVKGKGGLQVVLIPLDPCDLSLLEGAAKTYEKITGIPVKLRRLREPWFFASPERIPYQRWIQDNLIRMTGEKINFAGWSKDRYVEELVKASEEKDAITKYVVKDIIKKAEEGSGQYFVDPYLDRFSKILKEYRSGDNKTMYVGVTGANIFSGDNNFLFSLYADWNGSPASILSYYMMATKNTSEDHESRNRLVERLAKELVPASLKTLGIPRSTDPTCPYSYSSGVQRLDEKTLQLSQPVQEALERIRRQ